MHGILLLKLPIRSAAKIFLNKSEKTLLIYNLLGQEVYRFEIAGQTAGDHQFIWNGKNQRGNPLSSGLYIYRFSAGDFVQTRKMLLLK